MCHFRTRDRWNTNHTKARTRKQKSHIRERWRKPRYKSRKIVMICQTWERKIQATTQSKTHISTADSVAERSNEGPDEDRQGNMRTATEKLFQLPAF